MGSEFGVWGYDLVTQNTKPKTQNQFIQVLVLAHQK